MKTLDFLMTLREREIHVWADGDRLRCRGPVGTLTPEFRAELRERKEEILNFLNSAASLAQQQHAIVPLQSGGDNVPIFAVAGHNGDVFCFRALAQRLGSAQPFFGLQPAGLDGNREPLKSVEELAAYFAGQIRAVRASGPYVIAGYCAGGTIAFELARQLHETGANVKTLALFGSPFPTSYKLIPRWCLHFELAVERAIRHAGAAYSLSLPQLRRYIAERWSNMKANRQAERNAKPDPVMVCRDKVGRATLSAIRHYTPRPFRGHMTLFWPNQDSRFARNALERWSALANETERFFGPDGCDGGTMLREPHAANFAALMERSLRKDPAHTTAVARRATTGSPHPQQGRREAFSH